MKQSQIQEDWPVVLAFQLMLKHAYPKYILAYVL